MRVLGIDPSVTATGLAIVEDGRLAWWNVVKTSAADPEGFRLQMIYSAIDHTMFVNFETLDAVAIEGYAMGAKFNRESLGQVGGVIKLCLAKHSVTPSAWSPMSWRKTVLGSAKMAKDQVRLEAYKRFGVDLKDHNALEAYCVAMAEYLAQTGTARPRPKKRKLPDEEAA